MVLDVAVGKSGGNKLLELGNRCFDPCQIRTIRYCRTDFETRYGRMGGLTSGLTGERAMHGRQGVYVGSVVV
jgi:hypothetical protein